jgi:hypothetical protein
VVQRLLEIAVTQDLAEQLKHPVEFEMHFLANADLLALKEKPQKLNLG